MEPITPGLLAAIAVRTAMVLVGLVIGVRVFGRRQAGEMNVYDLLLILMMANAVQNAMTKANGNLLVAFTSAGTLLLLGWLIGAVIARRPWLRAKLLGSPTVIIHDGQIVRANVKREGLTEDEVATELRKRGLTEIDAVRLAILEIDGSLSVVPKDHAAGTGGGGDGR
jgi:uncharacterized membrane protein YcaP (DUF421 family)